MAYIYKIINDLNGKIYVGKTEFSIEKRFKEHCRDAQRSRNEKRPLYDAMQKYGIDHFHIELIEETDNPEEREKYWIEALRTFKYGYNATRGGDGTVYSDYDLVAALYKDGKTFEEISKITGYARETIQAALMNNGISKEEIAWIARHRHVKPVAQLNKETGEIIAVFPSIQEAERQVGGNRHIAQVCSGKRKSANGFGWKYIES